MDFESVECKSDTNISRKGLILKYKANLQGNTHAEVRFQ